MDLAELIAALSDPAAYPHPAETVEVRQTHISVVFLAGAYAYKVKKPVEMGFLDFSDLQKRHHFCAEEVRLNRRLAPSVYRDVVPIRRTNGRVVVAGPGEPIEWAVQMRRLPPEASLLARLQRGAVSVGQIEEVARRLARFHRDAARGPAISAAGRFAVVAGNARENFAQAGPAVGVTVHPAVLDRLRERTEHALERLRPLIEARAERGVPCETHGDLHADHVYLFPDEPPPDNLAIIDCIEFNERFRHADPAADVAFLVMDLTFRGRPDLARVCGEAWLAASGDDEARALLPFYAAYRAVVRAKVEGFAVAAPEIPASERATLRELARGHWLLALGELEPPRRRPALLLVGGLPGAGKSTLARGLAERSGFTVVRSDVVRKELAASPPAEGLYTAEWHERTYAACLRRAEELLFAGERVLIDASFREEGRRGVFLALAARLCVPGLFLVCQVTPETARARLERRRGDVSDADWSTHLTLAARWEPPAAATERSTVRLDADAGEASVLAAALRALADRGLTDTP